MRVHIVGGVLDGTEFESPVEIEKLIVQGADGRTERYEHDQDMTDERGDYERLVPTSLPGEFDAELIQDEARRAQEE